MKIFKPFLEQLEDFLNYRIDYNSISQTVEKVVKIVICIARLRNPTLTNREKNCRQGRFAAETRQSRGRQRIS
jgi:hypothetical protein